MWFSVLFDVLRVFAVILFSVITLLTVLFFVALVMKRNFLMMDPRDLVIERIGDFYGFRVYHLIWNVFGIIYLGNRRIFPLDISNRGLSFNDVFIHNFSSTFANILGLGIDLSYVLIKDRLEVHRLLVVSARSIFSRRAYGKVRLAMSQLSSYLSSIGFKVSYVDSQTFERLLLRGRLIHSGYKAIFYYDGREPSEFDPNLFIATKSLLNELGDSYTLILTFSKFPTETQESEEIREVSYKLGITYFENVEQTSVSANLVVNIGRILNNLIPLLKIKKIANKEKTKLTSVVQFCAWPIKNIKLSLKSNNVDELELFVSSGFLSFLLGGLEEEIIPHIDFSNDLVTGDLNIGYQLYNGKPVKPFYLNLEDLKRHVLIVGPTGAGKTTLAKTIIAELLKLSKPPLIWVLDFHGEYSFLRDMGFLYIRPGDSNYPLGLNIFESSSEDPEIQASFISSLISEAIAKSQDYFSPQMERIINIAMFEVLTSENRAVRSPPSFLYKINELVEELSTDIPTAKYSLHAIFNRLNVLFSGIAGKVFWVTKTNIDPFMMLTNNIVFDLSFFSSKEPTKRSLWLLVNILLRYMYTNIIGSYDRIQTEVPSTFIVVEEARYVAPMLKRSDSMNLYALEDLVILGRKYGVSLCFITQSANSISNDIVENAGTVFMMGDAPNELFKNFFSNKESRFIQMMSPGEAFVKSNLKSTLAHVKIQRSDRVIPNGVRHVKNGEFLASKYKPILVPYEIFIRKLLMREISWSDITGGKKWI